MTLSPPNTNLEFSFSDTIAGYVRRFDRLTRSFTVETSDGREFEVTLTPTTFGRITQNLGESYIDATGRFGELLTDGQFVYVYGVFYFDGGPQHKFEAKSIVFPGNSTDEFRHEEPDWWVKQIHSIADSYLKWQFNHPNEEIDYRNYRTRLQLEGGKKGDFLQETDTISRLVYGFASAFLLTGEDSFLEAAEKGTEYLRDHMRFFDPDENLTYWYHGIQVTGDREQKLLTSEFGDDFDSIPMYEQIYALAGPTQTFRATGDPKILTDIENTVLLFDRFYKDSDGGGYFSHIDPVTLDPRAESLGPNRARKNWNSVGDHAPAYLINLYLATGEEKYLDFLADTANTICDRFPDYEHSPFVQERFFEDWSHDNSWGWQQDRAVVGHNLKIAWNLMRIQHARPSEKYVQLARKIAALMPDVGSDRQRGGWYDVVERTSAARPERAPLRLARSQGLVAAGAGDSRLPDPARLAGRRGIPEACPRGGRVLQRVLPRPRRRRRVLQHAGQRPAVPGRQRAAQGQPLDVRLPLDGAVLPGGGLHQPADHQAAGDVVLQAVSARLQGPHPARLAGYVAAGQREHRAAWRSTASRTTISTPTGCSSVCRRRTSGSR